MAGLKQARGWASGRLQPRPLHAIVPPSIPMGQMLHQSTDDDDHLLQPERQAGRRERGPQR